MEYVSLTEEIKFSRIVLGFWRYLDWNLSKKEFLSFLESVMDLGVTTMDHADIYGNYTVEEIVGNHLAERNDLKKKMQIVTKCGIVYQSDTVRVKHYNTSKDYIIQQAETSLRKLQIETIDLFLIHRPDWLGHPEEIAEAFHELKKAGKIRALGVSNYLPHQFQTLQSFCEEKLTTNQIEVSPLCMDHFENGMIDLCMQQNCHPMVWSPLAGGRIFTSEDPPARKLRQVLSIIQEEVGAESIDEIMFAWLLSHPVGMLPITGSGDIEFVKKPIAALDYLLTPEQWYMIWTAVKGVKVP